MSKVITIFNKKGGEGKSTTTQALSTISAQKGNKVLVLDLDSQCNTTRQFLSHLDDDLISIDDVIIDDVDINKAILTYTGKNFKIDFIPSSSNLEKSSDRMKQEVIEKPLHSRLKKSLNKLNEEYTHIFIDTPPAIDSSWVLNALTASDELIVPITCSNYTLEGIEEVFKKIDNIKNNFNEDINISGIFINKERNTVTDKQFYELVSSIPDLLETTIPMTVDVSRSTFEDELLMEGTRVSKLIKPAFLKLYDELNL